MVSLAFNYSLYFLFYTWKRKLYKNIYARGERDLHQRFALLQLQQHRQTDPVQSNFYIQPLAQKVVSHPPPVWWLSWLMVSLWQLLHMQNLHWSEWWGFFVCIMTRGHNSESYHRFWARYLPFLIIAFFANGWDTFSSNISHPNVPPTHKSNL